VARLFFDLIDPLISFVFPAVCASCNLNRSGYRYTPACENCWNKTAAYSDDSLLCRRCGFFFGKRETNLAVQCRQCDEHHYDRAFACGPYEGALRASVIHLKEIPRIYPELRRRLASSLRRLVDDRFDLAVPVPLSPRRLHERGFNQAEIIARICAQELKIPLDKVSLQRIRETPRNRALMDKKARESSVAGAFSVQRPKLIAGRKILLVDDVLTSGATASNCAEALKKNGAERVAVFTLARAVPHQN
jgi:ComF family protein